LAGHTGFEAQLFREPEHVFSHLFINATYGDWTGYPFGDFIADPCFCTIVEVSMDAAVISPTRVGFEPGGLSYSLRL
jgi:hypothetical protein